MSGRDDLIETMTYEYALDTQESKQCARPWHEALLFFQAL